MSANFDDDDDAVKAFESQLKSVELREVDRLAALDRVSPRHCEHCGKVLPVGWPAVYCGNECAREDRGS